MYEFLVNFFSSILNLNKSKSRDQLNKNAANKWHSQYQNDNRQIKNTKSYAHTQQEIKEPALGKLDPFENTNFADYIFSFFKSILKIINHHNVKTKIAPPTENNKIIYKYSSKDRMWVTKKQQKELTTLSNFFKANIPRKFGSKKSNDFLNAYKKQHLEINTKYDEKLKEIEKSEMDFINLVNSNKRKKK